MDGVSAAASVIAVIQISGQVFDLCRTYYLEVKDARKDIQRLRDEVTSLEDVLINVADLTDAPGSAKSSLLALNQPDGPVQQCRIDLIGLAAKLDAGHGKDKMTQFGLRALKWPFSSKEVDKAITTIGRHKATFNLALAAATHQSIISIKIGVQREKIHKWLSAPDPSFDYNNACKKRQPTTGAWFVGSNQFADWKESPDLFLWLHGIPGCGKTILTSTIIDDVIHHCHLIPTLTVVYFYFDFNDIEKQQYEKMIRSLIKQLSIQCTSTPKALESLFSSCMNGDRQPRSSELLTTLQQMVQEFDEIFIVLDALDECKDRQGLLDGIKEIAGWKFGKLHIAVTSRSEHDIKETLEPLVTGQICIQNGFVDTDIHIHLRERLQNDPKLKVWPPKVQKEIEETLMDGAHGMFRWAICQLDTLRKCRKVDKLREALKSLPKTLDDTYARILSNIDEEDCQDAVKILQWLACSARPLYIEEVAEIIAVDMECDPRFDPGRRLREPQDVLAICSSLVTTTSEMIKGSHNKTTGRQIRLAHFSVKEYLMSERVQATQYSIQEIRANVSIAEICLAYLLQFDCPTSLTSQTIEEFPLARYAARYWTKHAQMAGKDDRTVHLLIMELFLSKRDTYVNWIRLCNPDYPSEEPEITKSLDRVACPLYYASLAGLVESTRLLLKNGADVNAQGGWYGSALQAASAGGHDQIVQRLLDKGADVNALQKASTGDPYQIVQRLLDKGADGNAQGGWYGGEQGRWYDNAQGGWFSRAQGGWYGNALQAASAGGHDQIVQRLLDNGADVNTQGGWYGNALQAASAEGHNQVVQRLLDNGATQSR